MLLNCQSQDLSRYWKRRSIRLSIASVRTTLIPNQSFGTDSISTARNTHNNDAAGFRAQSITVPIDLTLEVLVQASLRELSCARQVIECKQAREFRKPKKLQRKLDSSVDR